MVKINPNNHVNRYFINNIEVGKGTIEKYKPHLIFASTMYEHALGYNIYLIDRPDSVEDLKEKERILKIVKEGMKNDSKINLQG